MKKILLSSAIIFSLFNTSNSFAKENSNYQYNITIKIVDNNSIYMYGQTEKPVGENSFTHWTKNDNHIKIILSKKVGNKILASYMVGYQKILNNNICLGNIKQKGCYTAYADIENFTVLLNPNTTNHIPLNTLKDGHKRFLDITLNNRNYHTDKKSLKPVKNTDKDTIIIPKYNIELDLSGSSLEYQSTFKMSGDLGYQLAYGASDTQSYVVKILRPDIKDSSVGIVGAIIMKKVEKKIIEDNAKKDNDLSVFTGLDITKRNMQDYPGYGDPKIDGIKMTVKTDVNSKNNEWVPFKVSGQNNISGKIRVTQVSNLK